MRTVRVIRLKVDVSLDVLHTSRGRLVKVMYSASINFICIVYTYMNEENICKIAKKILKIGIWYVNYNNMLLQIIYLFF